MLSLSLKEMKKKNLRLQKKNVGTLMSMLFYLRTLKILC